MADNESKKCWSRNSEEFNYDDLGDLMDNYEDELRPGDTVWYAIAVPPKLSQMVDAGGLIEQIGNDAYEIGGEYAEDYPEVTAEHAAKLQTLLEQWLAECPPPRFYTVKDVQAYVLQPGDFTEERLAEIAEEDSASNPATSGH